MELLEKAKLFREKTIAKNKGLVKLDGCKDAVKYLIENGTKQADVITFLKQEAKVNVSGYLLKKFCQVNEIKSPFNRGNKPSAKDELEHSYDDLNQTEESVREKDSPLGEEKKSEDN
ncbi:MAG: hypothetical protein C0602_08530 [Denitrovibrio sp.]|nr:MAG: hypothetical protein C0602_08530 [Denitrovibrio sp.]